MSPRAGQLLPGPCRTLVNRPGRGRRTVAQVAACLEALGPRPPARALEVGCGGGAVAAFLAGARNMEGVATDLDPREARVALDRRPPGARLHVAVMDAARLALAGGGFDLVVAQHMLHHVPDWQGAVREAARVLRPGGHLIWIDLALPRWAAWLLAPFAGRIGVFTRAEVEAAFAGAGLRVRQRRRAGVLHRLVLEKTGE